MPNKKRLIKKTYTTKKHRKQKRKQKGGVVGVPPNKYKNKPEPCSIM